ncbi:MAG: radical SAM protein, partial [Lachnospiraceae bacterium]|nr:radical SAM protein [Lachnospiraceae bacterium]
ERIRLSSLEPRVVTDEFAARVSALKKVCPHFHLSLQSGSAGVLRRMNRHYSPDEYYEAVKRLNKVYDRPAITTDIIVGFPGETEEEFLETCEFAKKCGFSKIHIFPYSVRTGTKAAAMEGQLPEKIKK